MKLEDWEEPPALGDDWQERLRRTRQEQMEDFERRREKAGGLKLSGEEEVNDPAEEPPAPTVEEPEEELEDYSRYEETAAVRGELLYRRRMGWITLLASAVPELLLLWLALVAYLFSGVSVLHILVSLILLGVMVAVNYRTVLNGWKNLFHMAADADTPAAVASVVTLLHTGQGAGAAARGGGHGAVAVRCGAAMARVPHREQLPAGIVPRRQGRRLSGGRPAGCDGAGASGGGDGHTGGVLFQKVALFEGFFAPFLWCGRG